ncbi:MAG: hypothetical protein EOL88_00700 [Bacteroidia bacterium]|nr:hypothetical protein [Bacteroidia bacterium]
MAFKKNYHRARPCNERDIAKKVMKLSQGKYGAPKYLRFILRMLREGWEVKLYIPRSNKISKYVFVKKGEKLYKIRFSNHKPLVQRELDNDCDFYAGISNLRCMTTEKIAKIILGKK